MSEVCSYLYWIHLESHIDIYTEGYVGVSVDPDRRYVEHLKSGKGYYRSDFRDALRSGLTSLSIIFYGSVGECYKLESHLRPGEFIGWNVGPGGVGYQNLKHGLSKNPSYKVYNFHKAHNEYGFCEQWSGAEGVKRFVEFYEGRPKGCVLTFNPGLMSPENAVFTERGGVVGRVLTPKFESGELVNVSSLGESFNIRPNTISSRLSRGFSLDEALGLKEKSKRGVTVSGVSVEYNGPLSDKEIKLMEGLYKLGLHQTEISRLMGISSSNISRLVRRFKIER